METKIITIQDLITYIESSKSLHIEERDYIKRNPDYQGDQHEECLEAQNKYILICEEITRILLIHKGLEK